MVFSGLWFRLVTVTILLINILFIYIYLCHVLSILHYIYRKKEKQDIEDLEIPATKKVFLEQSSYKKQRSKEEKEYLDALNKEVKRAACTKYYHF